MKRQNTGIINFNFKPEQQKRLNLIWDETKRLYPELVVNHDDIDKERIKVRIAHRVTINDDKMPEELQGPKEQNEFNEINNNNLIN